MSGPSYLYKKMVGSVVGIGIPGALITVLLIGYYYGAGKKDRMSQAIKTSTIYGVILGTVFLAVFCLFGTELARVFLHEEALIHQAGYFISILGLSAPMLGIINMITSYFQALGVAVKSLLITVMRNIILFIPAVVILNRLWQLDGVIAAQPVVETLLAVICIVMYVKDHNALTRHVPSGTAIFAGAWQISLSFDGTPLMAQNT